MWERFLLVVCKDKVAKQVKNLPATAPDIIDYYHYEIVMVKFSFCLIYLFLMPHIIYIFAYNCLISISETLQRILPEQVGIYHEHAISY